MQKKIKSNLIQINIKSYGLLSLILLVLNSYFVEMRNVYLLFIMYISTLVNHFLLLKVVNIITTPVNVNIENKSVKIVFLMVFKTILLSVAFYYTYVTSHDIIINAVILYTFQLIILGLSIKR